MIEVADEAGAKAILRDRHGVSRETLERLDRDVLLLRQWQSRINLIAPSTLGTIWTRHLLDSAQLLQLASDDARVWCDMGSGAGLPGMVLAILMADQKDRHVHLIESNAKKAAFLREAARTCDAPASVHHDRIETTVPRLPRPDVVTARALADLDLLLRFSQGWLHQGALGLFPKGKDVQTELTSAQRNWHFSYELLPSLTSEHGRIVSVRMPKPGPT